MFTKAPALVNRSMPAVWSPPSTKFKPRVPVPILLRAKISAVVVFLCKVTGLAPVRTRVGSAKTKLPKASKVKSPAVV